jgi:glycosyltransferase involved in cell wall biosynthesis
MPVWLRRFLWLGSWAATDKKGLHVKVLFMTSWYPTGVSPFWGTFVREHAKAAARHHDVTVLHLMGHDPHLRAWWAIDRETDPRWDGSLPAFRVRHRMVPVPGGSFSLFLWSAIRAFRFVLARGFHPDVIHAHVYEAAVPAVLIGRRHGVPVVVTEHSSKFPGGDLRGLDWWKARFAFSQAQVVMPVSRFLLRAIQACGIRAYYQVIPNPVDGKVFFPKKKIGKRCGPYRLLAVGLLDSAHKKGIPFLLNSLVLLRRFRRDWHLDVVGEGPARALYQRMAEKKGLSRDITFHGPKCSEDVAKQMRQADVFVLTSPTETFSMVTVEALMTGTPVIVTASGGPEEYVSDQVGMLIPAGNEMALCEGLNAILNRLERFSPGHISQYAASHFSTEAVGHRLDRVYRAVVKKSNQAMTKDALPCGSRRSWEVGKH